MSLRIELERAGAFLGGDGVEDGVMIRIILVYHSQRAILAIGTEQQPSRCVERCSIGTIADRNRGDVPAACCIRDNQGAIAAGGEQALMGDVKGKASGLLAFRQGPGSDPLGG